MKRINGSWNNIQTLSDPDCFTPQFEFGEAFGMDIDIDGMTAVIGSPEAVFSQPHDGCAYVYRAATSSRSTWGLGEILQASDGIAGDGFGTEVALSGSDVAVGAIRFTLPPYQTGSVYAFEL